MDPFLPPEPYPFGLPPDEDMAKEAAALLAPLRPMRKEGFFPLIPVLGALGTGLVGSYAGRHLGRAAGEYFGGKPWGDRGELAGGLIGGMAGGGLGGMAGKGVAAATGAAATGTGYGGAVGAGSGLLGRAMGAIGTVGRGIGSAVGTAMNWAPTVAKAGLTAATGLGAYHEGKNLIDAGQKAYNAPNFQPLEGPPKTEGQPAADPYAPTYHPPSDRRDEIANKYSCLLDQALGRLLDQPSTRRIS